jgi:predicted peptidase
MKPLIITLMLAVMGAGARLTAQSLEQLKIAADAGDPAAQDQMAVRDWANSETWYRKAAVQGYVHSEGQLAIINDKTFATGDQTALKIDGKIVNVTCLEIRDSSVRVSIDGIEGTRKLKMADN